MIARQIEIKLIEKLHKGKSIILLGPRQVGKTTLLQEMVKKMPDTLWFNADEYDVQELFESPNSDLLKARFGKAKLVVIDEAQRIKNIGIKLKLITDQMKDIQLIATGSSSFVLSNEINEPLTGRKWEYMLYPISFQEMCNHHSVMKEKRLLYQRLRYGYYPEIVTAVGDDKELLKQLSDSYLYKDILMWQGIKKPEKIIRLLKALAYQIGNQVSYNELSRTVGLDKETVEKYIYLLEQSFIIYKLPSFSRNLRNELKRSKKIYFYDTGIRNSLLANFQEMELRADKGVLWENFLISERKKVLANSGTWSNTYFWRTHSQAEIDWIEERDGRLYAFEFKWNNKKKVKAPLAFTKAYPEATFTVINKENYEHFVTKID